MMKDSGVTASAFISASIGILLIGILAFLRKGLPFLEVYPPAGTFSGIWLYSYLIWGGVWAFSYSILKRYQSVWTLKGWSILLLISILVSTILIEASLVSSYLWS
ncbi:hypothetical protein A3K80_08025 [Candidatus Bathyarchaeota archaeon RBG_13_38_9]|nr:MAG: hypothetical protein A3K80_08025 [Candidatus Bathyarchaeota archaeon RBG_13_38_9]